MLLLFFIVKGKEKDNLERKWTMNETRNKKASTSLGIWCQKPLNLNQDTLTSPFHPLLNSTKMIFSPFLWKRHSYTLQLTMYIHLKRKDLRKVALLTLVTKIETKTLHISMANFHRDNVWVHGTGLYSIDVPWKIIGRAPFEYPQSWKQDKRRPFLFSGEQIKFSSLQLCN